jgi:branched-chain amino acid transport system substrate-binding protein
MEYRHSTPSGRFTRRAILTAGLLSPVAAAAAGCGNASDSTAAVTLPHGDDLVIGACLDLTGAASVAGIAAQRGLQVARDKLNQSGVPAGGATRQIRLVSIDTASDPKAAVAAVQRLIGTEKVAGLIAGGAGATATAMAPVAEQAGVPMISTACADDIVKPVVQRRFVFKLGPDAADVAGMLTDYLANTRHASRIALLATADDHGDSGVAEVTTAANSTGLNVVRTTRLPLGVPDYRSAVAPAVNAHPDAIIVWGVAPVPGLAARAIRGAGFTGLLLFDCGAASDDTLSAENRVSTQGSYLISPFILGGSPPAVTTPAAVAQRDFFDQYTRLFGSFSGLSVFGADALNLLVGAAVRANSTNRLRIRNGLESTPFDGLAGGYVFSTIQHGGVQHDSLRLFEIEQSGWVQLS